MSVWDSLVGQKPVIDMLSRIAQGDPSQITQSWLICGPPGSAVPTWPEHSRRRWKARITHER